MREHEINKLNNFIGGWYLDDTSICDELIEFYKVCPQKVRGYVADGVSEKQVNLDVKDSTDVSMEDAPTTLSEKYIMQSLQLVANRYVEKYRFADNFAPWRVVEFPNIQYYPPGGGFKVWHTERIGKVEPSSSRHLVFMTYLNDVSEGGETEFYYQQLKVKPEKGLTLIWGSDWTFTHRGIPSRTQEKYIITGWYNYV